MFLFNFTNFMKDLWSDLKDAWLLHKWILCAAAGLIVFFLLLFIIACVKAKKNKKAYKALKAQGNSNTVVEEKTNEPTEEVLAEETTDDDVNVVLESDNDPIALEEDEEPEVVDEPEEEVLDEGLDEETEEDTVEKFEVESAEEPEEEEAVSEEPEDSLEETAEEESAEEVEENVEETDELEEETVEQPVEEVQEEPVEEKAEEVVVEVQEEPVEEKAEEVVEEPKTKTPAAKPKTAKKAPAKKAVAEEPKAKEVKTNNRVKGKYEIVSSATGYIYTLKASNGESLIVSESYTSLKGCKDAIKRLQENSKDAEIRIEEDKNKNFQFHVVKGTRIVAHSANYSSKTSALNASKSFMKFVGTDVVKEVESDEDHLELVDLSNAEISTDTTGKIVIYNNDGVLVYKLLANNGKVICTSPTYKTMAALNGSIAKFQEAVYNGKFYILKDKNGNHQFKLYSANNRLIMTGESFTSADVARSNVASCYRFAKNAVVEIADVE